MKHAGDAETTEQADTAPSRLPAPMLAAILVSFAALTLAKGALVLPPLFALAVVLAYLFPARLSASSVRWLARLTLWGVAVLAALLVQPAGLNELIDSRWSNLFGYLCAAEIVMQAWARRPGMALLIFLACGVLLAASNTYGSFWVQVLTPVFILCLALAFPRYRPRPAVRPRGARVAAVMLFLAMLGLGFGFNTVVLHYRVALNAWGARVMTMYPQGRLGISLNPVLGRGPGPFGSSERVLRLSGGYQSVYYLRGIAFDTYSRGRWLPTLLDRPILTIPSHAPPMDAAGFPLRITKYARLDDLLFVPLATRDVNADNVITWSPEYGGPLESSNVMSYQVTLTSPGSVTIWQAPTPAQRERLLQVPPEVKPGVHRLAEEIGNGASRDRDKIQHVAFYLLTHYRYSTVIDPGPGDPASNFLLEKKHAHCEYFASAAVLLLRCLGVPARYVIGYYAHEQQPDGSMVVRQRDAHAWAEAWVDGAGWITVETTPSSGRPDARRENLPSWWQHVKDWTRDMLHFVGARIGRLRPWHLMIVMPAFLAMYLLLLLWRLFRQRTKSRRKVFHALPADRRQAELVLRFTAWLARIGAPCPPGTPWQEHLTRLEIGTPEQARAFVSAYNLTRFGPPRSEDDLADLSALLASLEKEAL